MTQSNPPGEVICPHCGQNYAMQPGQWEQYRGRTIACTKCGRQFAVGGSAQPASLPPPLPPQMAGGYPPIGYGAPPKKGLGGGAIAAIVIGVLCVIAIPCLISILLPALNKVRQEALKAKCASNMKNIAAAMITYANTNNGNYPDSMVTLIRSSGMSPTIYVCPDSSDTPLTLSFSSVTPTDLPGHCSYVYAAGGMTSSSGPNDVLVYEAPTDHHARGMNVLYGDYHVAWMSSAHAQQMIQGLTATPPVKIGP